MYLSSENLVIMEKYAIDSPYVLYFRFFLFSISAGTNVYLETVIITLIICTTHI